MPPEFLSLDASRWLSAGSALVAYSVGWWWGRRRLRARIALHLSELHDLQVNGIHSATYWKHLQH